MRCIQLAKLALLGGPGVGKDTFVRVVQKHFPHISFRQVRLAEPLYEVQRFIYETCSKEIPQDVQDGVLLNFLGKHMRSINPSVLLDRFAKALEEMEEGIDMVLCSDVRPVDAPFIKEMGFTLVHIDADSSLTLERRKRRGDLSFGESRHETEVGISPDMCDMRISNNGTLEDYEKSVIQFLSEFLS